VVAARREQDERSAAVADEFDRRRRAFYASVAPILVELMDRHRARAIFDETTVLLADQSLNITDEVIAELDARFGDRPPPAPPRAEDAAPAPPPAQGDGGN
jgi:Skp family chaperone for outer membrane proteins